MRIFCLNLAERGADRVENDTSRILIETIVRKTLREIKDSPRRSTRNLVDMALNFSEGRFQRRFFAAAQKMLTNEQSPYYALIQDTVDNVETEHLLQFGMNVGYYGCTVGARKIREIEKKEHYNIPWMLSFQMGREQFEQYRGAYQSAVSEGEKLGIHVWLLAAEECPQEVLSLVREHPKSGFALLVTPELITEEFLEAVSELKNLMLVLRCGEGAAEICSKLRKRKLLYALYFPYGEEDMEQITSGSVFRDARKLHSAITMLIAEPGCTETARRKVYDYVIEARNEQLFQTIVWETCQDSIMVDGIISQDACLAWFDREGQLVTPEGPKAGVCFRIFENSLQDILKQAFPKKAQEITGG